MTQMPLKDGSWLGNVLMTGAPPTMVWNYFDQGYRVIAVDWEPHDGTWYVDGMPLYHTSAIVQISQSALYLPLNTASSGYCLGNPDPSTHLRITTRLDGSGCGNMLDLDSAHPWTRTAITQARCHTPRRQLHLPGARLPISHALHTMHPHARYANLPRVT